LAAMKIRSLQDRDKSHKQVKDVADLHALLWYVKDYAEMKTGIKEYVSEQDLSRLDEALSQQVFENAGQLLQISSQIIAESIRRL